MYIISVASIFLAACQLAVGDLPISYDELLEGQIATYETVDAFVDEFTEDAPFMDKDTGTIDERSLLTPKAALMALDKRQRCNPGFGYCAAFGGCCPSSNTCCPYGYCLEPGKACCPTGPCGEGKTCCGYSHCMPRGAACCSDESYCEAGNSCYINSRTGALRCCTNSRCTARVEGGTTTYAPTSTTTRTFTATRTQYYYWTVTWYYYVYYWTLSVQIDAYIVTSTRTTEYSTLSVFTTGSSAANKYFSSVSRTLSLPTPASATSLSSLAGSTSYTAPSRTTPGRPTSTTDNGDNDDGGDNDDSGGNDDSGSNDTGGNGSGNSDGGSNGGNQGGNGNSNGNGGGNSQPTANAGPAGDSGAHSLWSGVDRGVLAFATFGTAVGVIAIML